MNNTLAAVEMGSVEWTTDYCTASAPDNLTFAVQSNKVEFSDDYGLYKLSADVTATVMGAESTLKVSIGDVDGNDSYAIWLGVADLDTRLVTEDFEPSQL